jgi:membrane peptidoglycan carboxypeptidase
MGIFGQNKKNRFTTRNGNTFKIHRSVSDRVKMRRDQKSRRRAERLSGMPKSRIKRFFYRLSPSNMRKYWLSREGGVMALKLLGIGFISGFLLLVGMFAFFRKDLPNLRDISGDNIGGSIQYYDRTGKTLLWTDYDAVKRIPVQGKVADSMKDATVAVEDKDFFKHGGFDLRGITRAAWNNVHGGGGTQGGSTITQQLVKLTQNWTQERTVSRKIKEVILAVELERSYSKKEILNGYLDTAPYGGVEYGVEAASRDYFNKTAKDLTLDESAMLATIPKSPAYYSPYSEDFDKEAFVGRQHYILDLMAQQGMITDKQRDAAKKVNTLKKVHKRKPKYDGILAPWFVLTAKSQLEQQFGTETVKRGGWKVITTLDTHLQKIAEDQVKAGLPQVRYQGGDTAAFAAEDVETGQMVAQVGGVDFRNKEFGENNFARLRLPPGSSFKPYDYAALIENNKNFGAGSVLYDTQGPLEGYPCTNKSRDGNCLHDYDFRQPGPLTLRYALGGSRNIPAVKAMLITGIDKTIETAQNLGVRSGYKCYQPGTRDINNASSKDEAPCGPSSAIGDGAYLKLDEHVHALGSISRGGTYIPQTYILKILTAQNKTEYEWKKEKGEQVIRPDTAYIMADMLSDPRASYMSTKPHRFNDWRFAAKTGTTNDSKDGWMTGFSTKYAAAVWVGYHTRHREMSGFMETMTRPIWQGWMDAAHTGVPAKDWQKPSGIQTLPAYVVRNHVGVGSIEPSPSTDLFPSWYQNSKKKSFAKKTIDIVSNKLATSCTPERARKVISETSASSFSGDTFVDGGGANTTQTDDVHKCSDKKPSISLSIHSKGGGKYDLSATVSPGTHPLSSDKFKGTVIFEVGGDTIPGGSYTVSSSGTVTYKNYQASFSGSKTVTATIVDSVLYDNSDSGTIAGSGSGSITSLQVALNSAGAGSAQLEWDPYPSASGYNVGWSKSGGGIGSCPVTGTHAVCSLTGASSGSTYTFTVTATGVSGSPSATKTKTF